MDIANYTSGWFSRKVNAFSQSAENIELDFRGDGPWLVAELPRFDGSYRQLQGINLDLHITNNDGNLEWVVSNPAICGMVLGHTN